MNLYYQSRYKGSDFSILILATLRDNEARVLTIEESNDRERYFKAAIEVIKGIDDLIANGINHIP